MLLPLPAQELSRTTQQLNDSFTHDKTTALPIAGCFVQSDSPCRIVIVDDVEANLIAFRAILELEGYEVIPADNGRAALALIEASPPNVVLLDLLMPGLNGYEVIEKLRQDPRFVHLPIVLITACDERYIAKGFEVGANAVLRKPIDINELLQQIRTLCS